MRQERAHLRAEPSERCMPRALAERERGSRAAVDDSVLDHIEALFRGIVAFLPT